MVFTPANPNVYTLNAAAWLLLELCDGQDVESLLAEFRAVYADQGAGEAPDVKQIIEDLQGKGILSRQLTKEESTP
ncbi:PqqD family protein [Variovorax sp. J31P207]|uniref:PqqD family protein n=1 Tax=Variovorax sp. J31P207 TaxID=3053510 RepID=UPI0025771128|nr:PqqD family protein [Variovorax sp. J31P207]MDM0068976.1 PqqD family protein [Variovorax sp. J31P207]